MSVQHKRYLMDDTSGAVFVEYLTAFIPMWTFFMCLFQLAFIAHANLIVKHSADVAVRSAAVVFPDNAVYYGGSKPNEYDTNSVPDPTSLGEALRTVFDAVSGGSTDLGTAITALTNMTKLPSIANLGSSRLNAVRLASIVPLVPLAGGVSGLPSLGYRHSVSFPNSSSRPLVTGPNVFDTGTITARVTFAYECQIPLARLIVCGEFGDLDGATSGGELDTHAVVPIASSGASGYYFQLQHDSQSEYQDAWYVNEPPSGIAGIERKIRDILGGS